MFKKILVVITVCICMTSCGNGKYYNKYHDELIIRFYNEFSNQGICGNKVGTCHGYVFFDGEYNLNINIYLPKDKEVNYSNILSIINDIYIRDNINITVIFFTGDKVSDFKWDAKKTFKVRYYSY